jgi:hypothetical protein
MVAKGIAVAALVAVAVVAGGYALDQARAAEGNLVTLTGIVQFTVGDAIGGFGVPTGYALAGQTDYEPLLLRSSAGSLDDPMFLQFEGHTVRVTGNLNFIELPRINSDESKTAESYWVLDVQKIELAE